MLSMNVQKQRRQVAQGRNRTRLIVDVDAVPLVLRNLPANYDFLIFAIQSEIFQRVTNVGFKYSFDNGARLSGAHHFRRGFGTGQQTESINDNRLSRTRFTGQEIESIAKVKFELVDKSEIPHPKKAQHTRRVISHRGLIFQWRRL